MSYHIVIPAHNEANYIGKCLESIAHQRLQPKQVVVVDDSSKDNTSEVVARFRSRIPGLVCVYHESKGGHAPGGKVVEAFNYGLSHINNFDYITKLDADIVLPENYFEALIHQFQMNPKLGLAGGVATIEVNDRWVEEIVANDDHVRGPIKTYRKACLDAMNGLRSGMGWDTADELLARFYGWEVGVFPDLKVKHLRATGAQYKSKQAAKSGRVFYNLRYGFLLSGIAALKVALKNRSFLILKSIMDEFLQTKQLAEPLVSADEGKFIRKYRWRGILKKLRILK